jgi:hypothetical protein
MTVLTKQVNNALVYYDADYPHRWYDAFGEGVVKYLQDFATLASDDTTGDATEWELTIVEVAGATTHVITDRAGGALLITTGTNENDGIGMQLGAAAGENIKLDGSYPLYIGARLALGDADQSDLFLGAAVTDTSLLTAVADAIYFRSPDATGDVEFVIENTNAESIATVGTLTDAGYVDLEFLFDGEDAIAYFNGQESARFNKSSPDFPDDQELRLSINFLTGEGNANTLTLEWLRMIHIR